MPLVHEGSIAPAGALGIVKHPRQWPLFPEHQTRKLILEHGAPRQDLPAEVNEWRLRNTPNLFRGMRRVAAAKLLQVPTVYGALWITVKRGDGTVLPYGLASLRVVTDAGVGFIVDAFQNLVEMENMKFHGVGTGGTAEAAGQTALVTELTTQYNPDSTRPTGTTTENAANIYRTVGTFSPDSGGTIAVTEHGIFSQAATGGGVMLDRSLFSVVNVVASADSITFTYDFTITSGG